MKSKSPISDHAADLQESERLNLALETKRKATIARICELEAVVVPRAETGAISTVRERIATLLNGSAPRNLFAGANKENELHDLINVQLPAITGAIEINRRELHRLSGAQSAALIADKAAEWRALNRERTLAIARAIAASRRCDAMQAEFQRASAAPVSVTGMNIDFRLRHGARPMTENDFFVLAVSEGWATRQEIDKELA